MSEPLLLADRLTKNYGSFRALDAVTLEVRAGEIIGLLGPNGSGKSTALRLFLGFLRATAGRCSVAGFDSWAQSVEVRRRVAYLPSELRLYETMTGRRLVRFLADLRGERYELEAERLAKQLDVPLDKPLTQLSSGMKPTNALDPTMRGQLLDQLALAKQRGQAVLFSSHVLAEVEQICDRVAILRRGELVHLQPMSERREGRYVRAEFTTPPAAGPDGSPLKTADGIVELEYRGPLPGLLKWLSDHPPSDVRIEPLGLGPIYKRIHGSVE
jgi:ABC-2 type transport system ATP-binding protein